MSRSDSHILVTGGGSGIGLAVAKAFAAQGAHVTVAGRNPNRLQATGFDWRVCDVTDDLALKAMIDSLDPVDVFIANAGAAATAPALKTPRSTWDEMIAVNLTSVYASAQAAVPPMVERGFGRFIAIASTASLKGYRYTGAYSAAKHGVIGWIRTLALELAKTGVTANAICPGFTDTPLIGRSVETIVEKTGQSDDDAKKAFTRDNPMGRLVDPEEVAQMAVWLASRAASSINGQAIAIDGGETAG